MALQIIHISMTFSHKRYKTAYSQLPENDTEMCSEVGPGYCGVYFSSLGPHRGRIFSSSALSHTS